MTAKAIADILLAIEAQVASLDWTKDGVDVWPLYRSEIRARLFINLVGAVAEQRFRPRLADLVAGLWPGFRKPSAVGSTVVMNDGYSLQRVGEQTIDRFCTPICEGLTRAGSAHVLVDLSIPPTGGLAACMEAAGSRVLLAKLRGVVLTQLGPDPWIADRCDRLKEAASVAGADPEVIPSARAMAARQLAMFDLARYFERLLRWHKASRVFVVSYYSVAGFAMNLAAFRLGVPAIDVQHGVINPEHTAYTHWRAPPNEGSALMPTAYWTWSEEEARIIREGVPLAGDAVVVGGHPFVEAWQAGWFETASTARSEAVALKGRLPSHMHALVTLQPGLMEEAVLRPLLDAMREVRNVEWWVRGHPGSQNDLSVVESLLKNTDATYDLEASTRLPLYALLENADIHLTHSSSTVIEAANFGVPSVLWSGYGEELFPALVGAGVALVGESGPEVIRLVRSARASRRRPGAPVSAIRLPDALLALSK